MSRTIKQIIDAVDEIKPNGFSPARKTSWISELEGRIQTEVFLQAHDEVIVYQWSDTPGEGDRDTQVLVEPPYDNLYELYLAAQIDFANNEYTKYANSSEAFNNAMVGFIRWFAGRYRPADGYREGGS